MHRYLLAIVSVTALLLVSFASANAQQFSAKLSGFNEIGGLGAGETGAILSEGQGTLTATLNSASLTYTLTFSGLSSNVTQAHIHFAKEHVAGGIFAFLCTNLGNGPAGTPACPATGGTVSGTITAASVIAVPGQNIPAGDFDVVEDALHSDTAYVNVHTVNFPAGEIRGQLARTEGDQGQNGD